MVAPSVATSATSSDDASERAVGNWNMRTSGTPRPSRSRNRTHITGGQSGSFNDSGSFTSVASANKGFLRVTPSNRYRLMNEADGSIPYFVGMNQSWDSNPDRIGVPAYSYDGGADTWNGSA